MGSQYIAILLYMRNTRPALTPGDGRNDPARSRSTRTRLPAIRRGPARSSVRVSSGSAPPPAARPRHVTVGRATPSMTARVGSSRSMPWCSCNLMSSTAGRRCCWTGWRALQAVDCVRSARRLLGVAPAAFPKPGAPDRVPGSSPTVIVSSRGLSCGLHHRVAQATACRSRYADADDALVADHRLSRRPSFSEGVIGHAAVGDVHRAPRLA